MRISQLTVYTTTSEVARIRKTAGAGDVKGERVCLMPPSPFADSRGGIGAKFYLFQE